MHPHLAYGLEVYGNTSNNILNKLCVLNNKLLRILLDMKLSTPVNDLYLSVNSLPLPVLFEFKLLLFTQRCVFSDPTLPEVFKHYFVENNTFHNYNTRIKNNIHLPKTHSSIGQRRTHFSGSRSWNDLPDNLRNISSQIIFKKRVKLYLQNRLTL